MSHLHDRHGGPTRSSPPRSVSMVAESGVRGAAPAPAHAALSVALLAGCSAVTPAHANADQVVADDANLPTTARPERSAEAIAELRARGPAGLLRVLAEYDRAPPALRPALAATVDAVAAQRYATASRLYWYTEPASALAEARRSGRPVLALRMLGRLDEDLSCANSRFFRTALYPDARVASLLRERFVLLWTSERPVPKVTIDFGDGRTMVGTVTGNSAHYVLDAEGRVVDVLPGLYVPQVFAAELRAVAQQLDQERRDGLTDEALLERRREALRRRLEAGQERMSKAFGALWVPKARRLLGAADVASALEKAQRATAGKAMVEVPLLRRIAVGVDPGSLPVEELALWASVGQAMFGVGSVTIDDDATPPGRAARRAPPAAEPGAPPHVLDAAARRLVSAVYLGGHVVLDVAADPEALLERFEQRMLADTALAEARLRPTIQRHLLEVGPTSMEQLGRWVYAEVFATPRQDAWLGLLPRDEYTGLPGDGVLPPRAVAVAR